jgi:hypothetical protein
VHDDPRILERCRVPTRSDPAWVLGDDELQALLRADGRAAGLTRIGNQVLVAAASIDPLPPTSRRR